jgi:hypothetical protein
VIPDFRSKSTLFGPTLALPDGQGRSVFSKALNLSEKEQPIG